MPNYIYTFFTTLSSVLGTVHWTKFSGWAITGYNDGTYSDSTEDKCKLSCLLSQNIDCRSIDFAARGNKDCILSTATRHEVGDAFSSYWSTYDYFDYVIGE